MNLLSLTYRDFVYFTYKSQLIRYTHSKRPKPITPGRLHTIINNLYKKAGLINPSPQKRYKLRAHNLRKYFRTQLSALGTLYTDHIEYMMGHQISTYHNIETLGQEFLRNKYANAGLGIKPKTEFDKLDMLKTLGETLGLNPNDVINKQALLKPHRTILDQNQIKQEQIEYLSKYIRNSINNLS